MSTQRHAGNDAVGTDTAARVITAALIPALIIGVSPCPLVDAIPSAANARRMLSCSSARSAAT